MLDQALSQSLEPRISRKTVRLSIDPARMKRLKDQEYKVMFWGSMPVFLVAALVKRLMPRSEAFHGTASEERRGVFAEAAHMAHTIIPFAFWR
ncbi:MAG: hypothetical protein AAF074_06400 [Pseudomonadota bacterium]